MVILLPEAVGSLCGMEHWADTEQPREVSVHGALCAAECKAVLIRLVLQQLHRLLVPFHHQQAGVGRRNRLCFIASSLKAAT